jgi:hypothetical protein
MRLVLILLLAAGLVAMPGSASGADARSAVDTTPPVISSPGNIVADATAGCGLTFCTNVSFSVSATDPDDPPNQVIVSCPTPNGTLFLAGTTNVTCTAHDQANNQANPVMFTVTVNVPPPSFQNAPASITTLATGPFGAVVTFVPPTATDPAGHAVTVTCDHLSGVTYPITTTTVTCSGTITTLDSVGNTVHWTSGSTQFTITVTPLAGGTTTTTTTTTTAPATTTNTTTTTPAPTTTNTVPATTTTSTPATTAQTTTQTPPATTTQSATTTATTTTPSAPRPYAGLTAEQARIQAVRLLHSAHRKSTLLVKLAAKKFDPASGRNAWKVTFRKAAGQQSSCSVYVWRGSGRLDPSCR